MQAPGCRIRNLSFKRLWYEIHEKTEGVFPKGVFRRPAGFLNQGGQGLVLAYMRTFCKQAQAAEF